MNARPIVTIAVIVSAAAVVLLAMPSCSEPTPQSPQTRTENAGQGAGDPDPHGNGTDEHATTDDVADAPPPLEIPTDPPTPDSPVTAGLGTSAQVASPGQSVTLGVRVLTAPTWHIYPPDLGPESPYIPVSLQLTLPDGITADSWSVPEGHFDPLSGQQVLEGDILFTTTLHIAPDAALTVHEIACTFSFQACDPTMCRPPDTKTLTTTIDVRDDD